MNTGLYRLVTRVLTALVTLFVVASLVFFVMRLLPGDPVLIWLGANYEPEAYARLKVQYGLDQPLLAQYAIFAANLLRGDLGLSVATHTPVLDELLRRIPITLELMLAALVVALTVGGIGGILAARWHQRGIDRAVLGISLFGISVPEFFLGAALMLALAYYWRALPPSGFVPLARDPVGHVSHLVLPAIALGLPRAAVICRLVRGSLVETLSRPYIRTARAKGLSRRAALLRHALRDALIPVVTVIGLQVGYLVGGAVVVEKLFVIPGVGAYGMTALLARDYPAIEGFVIVVAAVFTLANLFVDLAYVALDPRIRHGQARTA